MSPVRVVPSVTISVYSMTKGESIQEENRLPDREKRTKDVKDSSISENVSQVKCKGLVYGVFENVSDKRYAHPTRIKHKSKDVSVVVGWIQRKMESRRASQRNTNEDSKSLDFVIRYLMQ
jgi:hypothetical protein